MPKRSTLRLTKRIVDRLTADGKDTIFWDRDTTGFGVRVHTTGRKLYIAKVTTSQTTAAELIEPARKAVKAEISDRRYEAARREAARQAEEERREAEERRRKTLAEADAARAVLAKSIPEIGAAPTPASG